jgi:membrane-associated protease RseP (regulator of RpoE activity)
MPSIKKNQSCIKINNPIERTMIMRTVLQMIGYISIVFFLTTGTLLSASEKLSSGEQKKERVKTSGWIGVTILDVNERIARKAKLNSDEGAYVKEVDEDSPADSAGIQEGDIIIEFNGKKILDSDDLIKIVHRTTPGTKADVIIVRDGEKKTIQLIVGKQKKSRRNMFGGMRTIPDVSVFVGSNILGLQLLTLNEQLGEYFGAPNNEGVLVKEVVQKSTAEKAGFKAGDIIIRVGKKTVDAVDKIRKELCKFDEGDMVEFEIIRKNAKRILTVEMEEQACIQKNLFLRKPHMQMFRTDPFDDAGIRLEMDELLPEIDQVQREIERSAKDIEGWEHDIQKRVQKNTLPLPEEEVKL